VTGDVEILDEVIPFLEGEELKPGEHERMFTPVISVQTAPLWEHCRRALNRAWQLGRHGLPLIGNGDWNDGMNHVGTEGAGESVWLAWFLYEVTRAFSDCPGFAERAPAGELAMWKQRSATLAGAVEKNSWDGEWYLRAFFDDGSPLGSHANPEARIDSIAQSWAVLSHAGDPGRVRTAMESAQRILVDERNRLVLLFTPPFDHSAPHPGYIMGYPPGVRENGGQYTHGSLWLAMAWARLGDGERAVKLLNLMNPVEHSRDPETAAKYRGEPYVVAADVYAAPGRVGQSGWTWYTGSAAWMYRAWIEEVLGLRLRGDSMELKPSIPASWDGFEIRYRHRSAIYEIEVRRRDSDRMQMELDGNPVENGAIRLADDGAVHRVTLWLPRGSARALPAKREADSMLAVAQGSNPKS
jgi:cyclic beta-1,2-glucan glucanotransferase